MGGHHATSCDKIIWQEIIEKLFCTAGSVLQHPSHQNYLASLVVTKTISNIENYFKKIISLTNRHPQIISQGRVDSKFINHISITIGLLKYLFYRH